MLHCEILRRRADDIVELDTQRLGITPAAILGRGRATEQDRVLHSRQPLGRASLAQPSSPMIAGASAACFRRGRRPASGVRSFQDQMRRLFFESSVDRFPKKCLEPSRGRESRPEIWIGTGRDAIAI